MSRHQSCQDADNTIWWLMDAIYKGTSADRPLTGLLGEYRVSTGNRWAYLQNCLAECSGQEIT